jgi:hypothetical protein
MQNLQSRLTKQAVWGISPVIKLADHPKGGMISIDATTGSARGYDSKPGFSQLGRADRDHVTRLADWLKVHGKAAVWI